MHVIAFNASPRKHGNTYAFMRRCLDVIESEGITTELIQLADSKIQPCRGCNSCRQRGEEICIIDDPLNEWFKKIVASEGLLVGSPTYFYDIHPSMKCLLDRVGYLARGSLKKNGNHSVLEHKVAAAISVDAISGAPMAIQAMHKMFMVTQMIVPGACYWPIGKASNIGDAEKDINGMSYVEDLGRQMAWLIKKIYA